MGLIDKTLDILMKETSLEEQLREMDALREIRIKRKNQVQTIKPTQTKTLTATEQMIAENKRIPLNIEDLIADIDIPFGETLVRIRRSHCLSRKDVCEKLNVSPTPILHLENITDEHNCPGKGVYKALGDLYSLDNKQLRMLCKKNPWAGIWVWESLWDKNEPHLTVGKMLSILRDRKKLTRADVSGETGIQQSNLSRMENNNLFSSNNVEKYLNALGITINEFYDILLRESEAYNKNFLSMIID